MSIRPAMVRSKSSLSPTCTVPVSGASAPASTLSSVDFPAPFRPSKPRVSPWYRVKDTSLNACFAPYLNLRSRACRATVAGAGDVVVLLRGGTSQSDELSVQPCACTAFFSGVATGSACVTTLAASISGLSVLLFTGDFSGTGFFLVIPGERSMWACAGRREVYGPRYVYSRLATNMGCGTWFFYHPFPAELVRLGLRRCLFRV